MQSSTSKTSISKTHYWREHVEQWQSSGLSQKTYCQQHHLKPHKLSYWKNKLDSQREAKTNGGFVTVALESTSVALAQGLSLYLTDGHRIEGFSSVEELVVLVRALS